MSTSPRTEGDVFISSRSPAITLREECHEKIGSGISLDWCAVMRLSFGGECPNAGARGNENVAAGDEFRYGDRPNVEGTQASGLADTSRQLSSLGLQPARSDQQS